MDSARGRRVGGGYGAVGIRTDSGGVQKYPGHLLPGRNGIAFNAARKEYMKILILNGSPKGDKSTTFHTALYLKVLHPEHAFAVLHVGQKIRSMERNFDPVRQELSKADLVLFCYPVYTFLVPSQLQRLIELVKERCPGLLAGKFASQITTSKHFYDVTAHRFIEENCLDLGMKVIRGLSADMEDLLTKKGQQEARMFWDQLMFSCDNGHFLKKMSPPPAQERLRYIPALTASADKRMDLDVVIVADYEPIEDNGRENSTIGEESVVRVDAYANLCAMIEDFRAALACESRVINLREFPFAGGCLGCLNCSVTGQCIYRDGFDTFLREKIQKADAIVYAFRIENHYAHSTFKCFDDRQFCNGHRTVTSGIPVAYLLSGDYRQETNLQMVLEARSEVGGNYLCGIVTDEPDSNTAQDLAALARQLTFAVDHHLTRPANFYGVGGMKIFRDLIYVMQGMMQADHQFYKEHGLYDFPQRQKKTILMMKFVGTMFRIPSLQKKAKEQMSIAMVSPYQKVVEEAGQMSSDHVSL